MIKFQIIFLMMQYETSMWKGFDIFGTNFAVGNLQLSVRKLQLHAPFSNFLTQDADAA